MYKFRLPIGDWSGAGHGKCEYYLIDSNKPVEEVREIHFLITLKTGVDIESFCNEYQDCRVSSEIIEALISLGFGVHKLASTFIEGEDSYFRSEDMREIWLFLLMKTDPTLKLEIAEENVIEMLPFYGDDAQGRSINFVGYGAF
jgi:hypothetical protein